MALPIPVPGVRDIIDGIRAVQDWFQSRQRDFLFRAWRETKLTEVYSLLLRFYSDLGENLFTYPGGTRMPILVYPELAELSASNLIKKFSPTTRPFSPAETQQVFWKFYSDFRQLKPYDLDVFRLDEFRIHNGSLHLSFELGKFSHSVMCQYILEHEILTELMRNRSAAPESLTIRSQVAADEQMIRSFTQQNIMRIGICNLILLRKDASTYVAMVQPRGQVSMIQHPLFDPVSSCVFEVATTPKADFNLIHTVLREIYEELFGNPDVMTRSKRPDPKFFYKYDGISDLCDMIASGSAIFEVTGFCIDLVRLVPEITTLLVVREASYFRNHYRPNTDAFTPFCLNEEFEVASLFEIPANLTDVNEYLVSEIIRHPDGDKKVRGFDPMNWTLPGGFSFFQGLHRAVVKNLF